MKALLLTGSSHCHFYKNFLEKFVGSLQKITIVHSKICQRAVCEGITMVPCKIY